MLAGRRAACREGTGRPAEHDHARCEPHGDEHRLPFPGGRNREQPGLHLEDGQFIRDRRVPTCRPQRLRARPDPSRVTLSVLLIHFTSGSALHFFFLLIGTTPRSTPRKFNSSL